MVAQVRSLIAQIQEHTLIASANTPSIPAVHISGVDPLAALPTEVLSIKPWQPPGIDEIKVSIAPGVVCPSAKVIDESGKRVQELVHDVERFAAVEDLFHQTLDSYGIPVRSETRKYNYVASISEPQPGVLNVDEYRAEKMSLQGYPDQIASQGFAALALVFHPDRRDEFAMTCEGLGEWHGQATWLVRFQQREDRPNHMHAYKLGNRVQPVPLKGRAWITADRFQIARIEAEMVRPMPEIQLLSEHQIVEYGPVPFANRNTTLWLPKSADIYLIFGSTIIIAAIASTTTCCIRWRRKRSARNQACRDKTDPPDLHQSCRLSGSDRDSCMAAGRVTARTKRTRSVTVSRGSS